MSDARSYPERPYLAVSAAIVRDGKILVVRRARAPAHGLFSLPGGVVEVGETLVQSIVVSNIGTGVAHDVVVHARVPEGLEHPRGKVVEMVAYQSPEEALAAAGVSD